MSWPRLRRGPRGGRCLMYGGGTPASAPPACAATPVAGVVSMVPTGTTPVPASERVFPRACSTPWQARGHGPSPGGGGRAARPTTHGRSGPRGRRAEVQRRDGGPLLVPDRRAGSSPGTLRSATSVLKLSTKPAEGIRDALRGLPLLPSCSPRTRADRCSLSRVRRVAGRDAQALAQRGHGQRVQRRRCGALTSSGSYCQHRQPLKTRNGSTRAWRATTPREPSRAMRRLQPG